MGDRASMLDRLAIRRASCATIHISPALRRPDGAVDGEADTISRYGDAGGGIVALATAAVRMKVAFSGNTAPLLVVGTVVLTREILRRPRSQGKPKQRC